jgi:hypothetical protein
MRYPQLATKAISAKVRRRYKERYYLAIIIRKWKTALAFITLNT